MSDDVTAKAQSTMEEFLSRREQKRQLWDTLREEAKSIVGTGFSALDKPVDQNTN